MKLRRVWLYSGIVCVFVVLKTSYLVLVEQQPFQAEPQKPIISDVIELIVEDKQLVPTSALVPFKEVIQTSPWRIVVVTHNRPEMMRRCLEAILPQPGIEKFDVSISLDDAESESYVTAALTELSEKYPLMKNKFKLIIKPSNESKGKEKPMSQHVFFALKKLFEGVTEYGILLEEDLVVSPDFLELMVQSIPIIENDHTLFCASGWNDNGFLPFASDHKKILRTDGFPGYGWLVPRRSAKPFLIDKLPGWVNNWGAWFDGHVRKHNLECIVPEVPRTRHIGGRGVHIKDNSYYDNMTYATVLPGQGTFEESLATMKLEDYDLELMKRVEKSVKVDLQDVIDPDTFKFEPFTEYFVPIDYKRDCKRLVDPYKLFHVDYCKMTHKGLLQVNVPHKQAKILFVDTVSGKKWL